MAANAVAQGSPSGPGADILTSEEFARRVHIRRVQTVQEMCAAGQVPGATKIGHEWRIHWPTFWAWLAGPGVPEGAVVTAAQVARQLRVENRVLLRASAAPPAPPDKFPGRQLGRRWLYPQSAVEDRLGFPLFGAQDAAAPGPPAVSYPAQSLDFPPPATGQAPAALSPGPGAGAAARHRRRPRSGPGSSPAVR